MILSIKKHSSRVSGRHRSDRSCPSRLDGRSLTPIKTRLFPTRSAEPVSAFSAKMIRSQSCNTQTEKSLIGGNNLDGRSSRNIEKLPSNVSGRHRSDRSCPGCLDDQSPTSFKTNLFHARSADSISINAAKLLRSQSCNPQSKTSLIEGKDIDGTNSGVIANGSDALDDFYRSSTSSKDENYFDAIDGLNSNVADTFKSTFGSSSSSSDSFSESSVSTEESTYSTSWETDTTNPSSLSSSTTTFYDSGTSRTTRTTRTSRTSRTSKVSRTRRITSPSLRSSGIVAYNNGLIFSNSLIFDRAGNGISTTSSDETASQESLTTDSNTYASFYDTSTCRSSFYTYVTSQDTFNTQKLGIHSNDSYINDNTSANQTVGKGDIRVQTRNRDISFCDGNAQAGDSTDMEDGHEGGGRRSRTVPKVSVIQETSADQPHEEEKNEDPKEEGFEVFTLGRVRVTWYPHAREDGACVSPDAAVMKVLGRMGFLKT